ncbi:MAG: hypothetical protein ACM335_04500 [Deltaproteobacteria bacterium]
MARLVRLGGLARMLFVSIRLVRTLVLHSVLLLSVFSPPSAGLHGKEEEK